MKYFNQSNSTMEELVRHRYVEGEYPRATIVVREGKKMAFANLKGADLQGEDFYRANLSGANLIGANLKGADLGNANLQGANLSDANLQGANLRYADLSGADLTNANLQGADLYETNLCDTNLGNANIKDANVKYTNIAEASNVPELPIACPSEGSFVAWKLVWNFPNSYLIKLEIPTDARRCSATTKKCRCDKALVLDIENLKNGEHPKRIVNHNYCECIYEVGEMVYPDSFDENRWNECTNGIHFFMERQDAIGN